MRAKHAIYAMSLLYAITSVACHYVPNAAEKNAIPRIASTVGVPENVAGAYASKLYKMLVAIVSRETFSPTSEPVTPEYWATQRAAYIKEKKTTGEDFSVLDQPQAATIIVKVKCNAGDFKELEIHRGSFTYSKTLSDIAAAFGPGIILQEKVKQTTGLAVGPELCAVKLLKRLCAKQYTGYDAFITAVIPTVEVCVPSQLKTDSPTRK